MRIPPSPSAMHPGEVLFGQMHPLLNKNGFVTFTLVAVGSHVIMLPEGCLAIRSSAGMWP